jgi:serine protease Do
MKSTLSIAVAVATCLSASGVRAQEGRPPQPPEPPRAPFAADPGRPPAPPRPPEPPSRTDAPRHADGPRQQDAHGDHHQGRQGGGHHPQSDRGHGHGEAGEHSRLPQPPGPQPFLGVVTNSVPAPLSAQLGLQEGFGLLVQEILPNSPASEAGIQKHDILKLLNDQQLVEPGQLATLIRSAGKDAQVTLTIIRKGQEQKVTAKVGERALPRRRPLDGTFNLPMPGFPQMQEHSRRMQEHVREQQERVRKMHEEIRDRMQRRREGETGRDRIPPEDILREAKPGGGAQIHFQDANAVTSTIDGAKARFIFKDKDGEMEVSSTNGQRVLIAKSPAGDVVFQGPVDTDDQLKAVPEDFRKKLDRIKIRAKVDESGAHAEALGFISPDEDGTPFGEVQ